LFIEGSHTTKNMASGVYTTVEHLKSVLHSGRLLPYPQTLD
jgi:hypothetical protein